MQQAIQIRRPQTTLAQVMAAQASRRQVVRRPRTLAQGTPVDLTLLFWGGSLALVAAYLLGGRGGSRRKERAQREAAPPPAQRKAAAGGASSGVVNDAVSALRNLGYSRADATKAVNAARRSGASSFDVVMREAMRQLA